MTPCPGDYQCTGVFKTPVIASPRVGDLTRARRSVLLHISPLLCNQLSAQPNTLLVSISTLRTVAQSSELEKC